MSPSENPPYGNRPTWPFPDWTDPHVWYIDGSETRNTARHIANEEAGDYRYVDTKAHRVWMRRLAGPEAEEYTDGEYDEFFVPAEKGQPDAFPMWRVEVPA